MGIASHLCERHGYSLAEAVKRSPREMLEVHEAEHAETECDHVHDQTRAGFQL